ncbi:hypothetical protein ABFS83_02G143100 [Erythranthe nasuta]
MDSRVPAPPSKPLHNFDLPITLRWSKLDGNAPAPGGVNRQLPLRHVRSPPRRPKTVFPASLLETLSGGSVSSPPPLPPPPPPRRQYSSGEISSRQPPFPGGGFQTKQTPIRGDSSSSSSSKPSLQAQERKKPSAAIFGGGGGGEPDQQMLSWFRGQAARSFPSRDWPPLEPSKKTDQSGLIKHSRNNYPFDTIKNGAYSSSNSAGKSTAAAEKVDEKKKSKGKQVDGDPGRIIKKSKIVIKIPCKNNSSKAPQPPDQKKQNQNPPPAKIVTGDQVQEDKGKNVVIDDETKIWNLRPRKTTPFKKSSATRSGKNATVTAGSGGGADKGGGGGGAGNKVPGSMLEKNKAGGNDDNQSPPPPLMKSAPPKNEGGGGAAATEKKADGGGEVKKKEIHKKPILTIALTKREIEEDIYALTGAKPARRPRKRPKNVQKQLDMVFPGLWLVNNYS